MSDFERELDEILYDHWARHRYCKNGCQVEGGDSSTIEAINQAVETYIIGEDERIDIQSDFDKIDVPHLETDRYPGLDGVRQASRNILKASQRKALHTNTKEEEK